MVKYDPRIIRKFASRLYSSAQLITIASTLIGAGVLGVPVAYFASNQGLPVGQTPAVAVAAAIGGFVGLLIGLELGFMLKLRAQMALCQLQIEANTRDAAAALTAAFPPSPSLSQMQPQ